MADGKCQICGMELSGVFHVDHIMPFSKGGATDVVNAQILCERCNMSKSNHWNGLNEWGMKLRDWQERAFETYLASSKPDVLVDATPGAGKTFFGLRVIHHELQSGAAKQVLIVVPSENLRKQWATEAARFGIHLTTNYDAAFSLASDYHGVVTTYQTISARMNGDNAFRKYTSRHNTLGVLDEIHHIGESNNWGEAIKSAMSPCMRRLIITGTPFRSDRNMIPFVDYARTDDGGFVCVPDFQYGYGDALRDGVVRHVYFQTFDGDVSWFSNDGQFIEADFGTELNQRQSAERLRMTMNPNGEWLRKVITDASQRLDEMRKDDPTAGGLIVTRDVAHAKQVACVVADVTGKTPTVVTSDEIDSAAQIDAYRNDNSEWIVAVKMVSEGVDIRRLRVGVWATNTQTELFFRQVVGRIVRIAEQPEDQYAYQYIPKLEPLTTYANRMKEERSHVVDDLDSIDDLLQRERTDRSNGQTSIFVSSDGEASDLLHGGDTYTKAEYDNVAKFCTSNGLPVPTGLNLEALIKMQRHYTKQSVVIPSIGPIPQQVKTIEEQKQELRRKRGPISRAVRSLVEATNGSLEYAAINRAVNDAQSVTKVDECTLEQLRERIEILIAWRKAYDNGTGRNFTVKGYLRQRFGQLIS